MPPLDDEVMSAFLSPKNVLKISGTLLHSSDPEARMVGRHINDSLPNTYFERAGVDFPIEIAAAAASEPEEVLDTAIRGVTKGGKTIPRKIFSDHFQNATNWAWPCSRNASLSYAIRFVAKARNLRRWELQPIPHWPRWLPRCVGFSGFRAPWVWGLPRSSSPMRHA